MGNDGKEPKSISQTEVTKKEGKIENAQAAPELSAGSELQKENAAIVVEIQETETLSRSMETELTANPDETSLERTKERLAIDPSIYSYFKEMGPEECFARLKKMSKKGVEIVVGHIKKGNLPMVVHFMEMFSPDNVEGTNNPPADLNDKEAWKAHSDKFFAETMRKFGVAARHDTASAKSDPERWKRLWEILGMQSETKPDTKI